LHSYHQEKKAELACLYVSKTGGGEGHGQKLMNFAERLAAEKGMQQIFALSTQAFAYFQQKGGYHEVAPSELPQERREKYEASNRNSKILMKDVPLIPKIEVLHRT
jgi:amino-acid N-acetyltransferase